MTTDTDKTTVIFRVWRNGHSKGEVIALFPNVDFDGCGLYCNSFEHVGQHGAAIYTETITRTRPATPAEYADLKHELETQYGYNLDVRKRWTQK